jgi:hypothetical protein
MSLLAAVKLPLGVAIKAAEIVGPGDAVAAAAPHRASQFRR